ncbi:MAG: radical SAM protein [Patescibacteria group bacterium]
MKFVYLKNTKAISLSGRGCSFQCAHCEGHYLEQMNELADSIPENVTNLLISGGLKPDGSSFIFDRKDELLNLKKKGYTLNSHVGFVAPNKVDELAKIVDYVSFDFVTDAAVIKRVYKIDRTGEDYIEQYKLLSPKVKVYPHITIGLDGGRIHWEYGAIDKLKELGADRIIFNVLIPTPGTEFENAAEPDLAEVRKVLQHARKVFADGLVIIGCMRPGGAYRAELDKIAVEEGVDRLVQPTPAARELAEKMGLEIGRLEECCAL